MFFSLRKTFLKFILSEKKSATEKSKIIILERLAGGRKSRCRGYRPHGERRHLSSPSLLKWVSRGGVLKSLSGAEEGAGQPPSGATSVKLRHEIKVSHGDLKVACFRDSAY